MRMPNSGVIVSIAAVSLLFLVGCATHSDTIPHGTDAAQSLAKTRTSQVPGSGFLYVANSGGAGSVTAYVLGQASLQRTIKAGVTTPIAVAADSSGTLYVADPETVSEYAPGESTPLRTISNGLSLGSGSHPQELALDAQGDLYVANAGACYPNDTVNVYAPGQITATRTVTLPGGECKPFAVAVDGQNDLFAITQTFTGHAGSVFEYAPGGTTPSRTITTNKNPIALALGGNGNLYVVNNGVTSSGEDSSVSVYEPGQTTPARTIAGLQFALADTIDAAGKLYVADTGHNVVKVFAAGSSSLVRTLPAESPGALAFDPAGNLYVLNQQNGTVSTFDSESTTPLLTVSAGIDVPTGIAVGAGTLASVPCGTSGSGAAAKIDCSFKPNAVTISTSEGAPYGDVDFWTLANTIPEEFAGAYGPTRIMRAYICLSGMVPDSQCATAQASRLRALTAAELHGISTRLALFRGTGVRVLVRFTYNLGSASGPAPDAPLKIILKHLSQLAPIVRADRDVVFGLEAGFIGDWGEWHDSTYGNDTVKAQNALLAAEFHDFPGMFPILIRYPGDTIAYFKDTTVRPQAGIHDDCYASQRWDCGTFNSTYSVQDPLGISEAELRMYAQEQSTQSVLVGEPAGLTPTYDLRSCQKFLEYAYSYHLQSFNIFTLQYPAFINGWAQQGCLNRIANGIGTRIVLQHVVVAGAVAPSATLHASLTMVNDGFGRVVRERPVTVAILANGAVIAQAAVPSMDLRTLKSSNPPVPETFSFDISLPENLPAGTLTAALYIADPAMPASAVYALPLNSVDSNGNAIFNALNGYNTFATLAH